LEIIMTITTHYNGVNWIAAATFNSTFSDQYEEFYNSGVAFDSPERATFDLLTNLSRDPGLTQTRTLDRPTEEVDYRLLTHYVTYTDGSGEWFTASSFIPAHSPYREHVYARGATPDASICAILARLQRLVNRPSA
jgi:hypothetical protein